MTTPSDVMKLAMNAYLNSFHTCLPAQIVDYDFTKQRASVQPVLRKKYLNGDTPEMSVISNVPVVFPRGGGFNMSWPMNPGDTVLLLFSERSMDNWLETGGIVTPLDPRKFDLSDPICIPGLIPFNVDTGITDNTSFMIRNGSARMKISPDGTYCFHGATEELMSIIDELFTLIESITVTANVSIPVVPVPINNSAAFTALQVRFNTLKGNC